MKAMIKLLVVLAMIILMAGRMLAKFHQVRLLGERRTEMLTIMANLSWTVCSTSTLIMV